MCKVKQTRCPGVLLESKPVSYSWFPAQVGPQVSNPGYSIRADILDNVVAGKAHARRGKWKTVSGKAAEYVLYSE
jgi:hypothetical protein